MNTHTASYHPLLLHPSLGRRVSLVIFVSILFMLCMSCNPNPQESYVDQSYEDLPQTDPKLSTERSLIQYGEIRFQTNNLEATRRALKVLIIRYHAYIAEENQSSYDELVEQRLSLRVPSEKFDSLLHQISLQAEEIDYKQVKVEDVTEKFIDINARLKNKKELETRYVELLSKAADVSEILAIEEQLGKQREDIEVIEGKLKFLQDQVAMSELNVSYYQNISHTHRFANKLLKGLQNGWNNFLSFLIGLVNIWPFIILLFLLIISWRKLRRTLWQKRKIKNRE